MSMIASAATAASPTVNLFSHGHKKGSHAASGADESPSMTQGPATTQSLLSTLFQSKQQEIGISLNAPPGVVSDIKAAAGTAGAASSSIGANVNVKV